MSNLPGHSKITRQAVNELATEHPRHPIYSALGTAGLQTNVVARDIIDVLILGHWADFGQCHHFMRRFDGQSEREAYAEAVGWIKTNALESAQTLSKQIHAFYGSSGVPSGPAKPADLRGVHVLTGDDSVYGSRTPSWQSLGNAIHCIQDSFAWGHVEREAGNKFTPGAIRRVKRYAGAEKNGHEEADKEWWEKGNFSQKGRFAINATKGILKVVVESALAASAKGGIPGNLLGFGAFEQTHVFPSSNLSSDRDLTFDLIDRHYRGFRVGATNVKTVTFDEEGLAKALINLGTKTDEVLKVFERLDKDYNSDADDVAELYVNEVRRRRGALEGALRMNRSLVNRLIKVMNEGWTSSGEQACIDYLRGLL